MADIDRRDSDPRREDRGDIDPRREDRGNIDARAVVSERARLGPGVRVGAYAIVGDDVTLGAGSVLHAHAVVQGPARLGVGNVLHPFCSIGGDPQDLKFAGERTTLEAGDRNVFREYVSVNRGTAQGGGITQLGSDNLFLAGAHVGHDCVVGSHTLFVNGATLAGHVTVEDYATVGAFSPVHQFCRIGRYAYIGASTVITQDVPPFALVVTKRSTQCYGVNTVGLKRHGFLRDRIHSIDHAYHLLLHSKLNTSQAIEQMRAQLNGSADVAELVVFIESATRGVTK
jgi:UDP-N-acetylglucosamine acyltransferase